jgi:alkylation response protein AidB-like acyl-CoA dehydrogenase
MPSYTAPVKDMEFVLYELLNISQHADLPGFEDATPDLVSAILQEGAKITQEVFQPLNRSGDEEGCQWNNGEVTTPKGFKEAYQTYVEGGWNGLTADPAYGGQGMPYVLGLAISEMMVSANQSLAMYPGLTHGAIEAIRKHASDELKAAYLPKMISGEWTGTMNLTEPQCGTDLGLMRTKAVPAEDGSYRITGTKIFISAGEQDITSNIIHLVLAKIPGGPEGIKGVSLFLVPKFRLDENGEPGEHNGVSCGSIEKKMGIHGNATCVLNYDDAVGYLVGEQHKGMRAMFTMMNAARLGVGLQGLCASEVSYQNAVTYARDRLQGRSLSGPKAPDKPADPIIVHPDIRRMLMTARAFNEGARAVAYWAGLQVDLAEHSDNEETRQAAEDLLGILTPVIKAFFTDMGYYNATNAQQVYGGHGYIREWGMEQFVRDARIAQIYEGANGIQALDLVGRKLAANGGRAVRLFLATIQGFIEDNKDDEKLKEFTGPLSEALTRLQQATMWLMQNAMTAPDNAGAASMDYLYLMGHAAMAFSWAQIAKVAHEKLDAGQGDAAFYSNKLITGRYYVERMLPDTIAHLAKLETGAHTMMALDADAF